MVSITSYEKPFASPVPDFEVTLDENFDVGDVPQYAYTVNVCAGFSRDAAVVKIRLHKKIPATIQARIFIQS